MNDNLPVAATTRLDRARDNAPSLFRCALQLAAYVAQQPQDDVPARALQAVDMVNTLRLAILPPEHIIEWTDVDRVLARAEGWDLMRHGPRVMVVCVHASETDPMPPFADDKAAHRWVVAIGSRGLSKVAIKGLAYLNQEHVAKSCVVAIHAPLDRP